MLIRIIILAFAEQANTGGRCTAVICQKLQMSHVENESSDFSAPVTAVIVANIALKKSLVTADMFNR